MMIFFNKWQRVYQICKKQLGYQDSPIGHIQRFESKRVGPYHIIKNILYALKKGSSWVNNARQQSIITFPFNPDKFSFNTMPYCQIIGFIDLQKGLITYTEDRQGSQLLQPDQYKTEHILKISKSQIANGHCIFIPYLRQNHPQILTPKLILSVLQLKALFPSMKVGFNSQGAGSTVNHFHAQMIDPKSLINDQSFHFQTIEGKIMTKFKIELQNEISTDIIISSFQFIGAMFIKVHSPHYKVTDHRIMPKIVDILYKILQLVFEITIPHQLNIPNQHSVYLILRNYSLDNVRYGWVQFSGIVITTSEQQFTVIRQKDINKRFKKISLPKWFLQGKINKI